MESVRDWADGSDAGGGDVAFAWAIKGYQSRIYKR